VKASQAQRRGRAALDGLRAEPLAQISSNDQRISLLSSFRVIFSQARRVNNPTALGLKFRSGSDIAETAPYSVDPDSRSSLLHRRIGCVAIELGESPPERRVVGHPVELEKNATDAANTAAVTMASAIAETQGLFIRTVHYRVSIYSR